MKYSDEKDTTAFVAIFNFDYQEGEEENNKNILAMMFSFGSDEEEKKEK